MLSRLLQVQEECQRVASAIACVLGVEVEVIDRDLLRVAGTGQVRNDVGSHLLRGFVNKHALKHREPIFIGEAGRHAVCASCPLAGRCFYLASIVYPVLVEDEIAGTISLIAFDGEQRARLHERTGSLMEFVGGLAGLIGALVLEKEAVAAKMIMASQLQAVMDAVDESVVAGRRGKGDPFQPCQRADVQHRRPCGRGRGTFPSCWSTTAAIATTAWARTSRVLRKRPWIWPGVIPGRAT